jgi:methionyl-tRNA formyltransferase
VARILLLTAEELVVPLTAALSRGSPGAALRPVHRSDELAAAIKADPSARLLCVGSGVIVPEDLLRQLQKPAYNIHPGPPEYPGLFPSVFALYDGAKTFGVTLHEMAAVPDSGAIVAVDRFDIPGSADRLALDMRSFEGILGLVQHFAGTLVGEGALPHSGERWSGTRRTRKDFDALCELPANVSRDEFERRYRAVGEGPHHALRLTLHGHSFRLDNDRADETVVRAGQAVTR